MTPKYCVYGRMYLQYRMSKNYERIPPYPKPTYCEYRYTTYLK